ncbi:hypothetical protein DYB28_000574 [Aphanomyces astaci]|uniref:Peptidase S74 domain-containing protein n=1 Tax=Aphanomyces astaci TaxID=112090 RepID=A0A9X8DIJ6_APHAT|nr:hypothetical protein DYB28_000574 [Aphanomyces astaci]
MVSLSAGTASSVAGASVLVQAGASSTLAGGSMFVQSGSGASTGDAVFGSAAATGAIGASGSVTVTSGDSSGVSSGDLTLGSGSTSVGSAGLVQIYAGQSATVGSSVLGAGSSSKGSGGAINLNGGASTTSSGGSIALLPGKGISSGTVTLASADKSGSIVVGADGSITATTAPTAALNLFGGNAANNTLQTGEWTFSHAESPISGNVNFRMQKDRIVSHVPASFPVSTTPSDRRIKTEIEDVDQNDILHRMQSLEVKQYRYTKEWQSIGHVNDDVVRGVIAQQVAETFPEYIHRSDYHFPEKNFTMGQFHEVNKHLLTIDLLAAMQAHHRRFTVGRNNDGSTASIQITTEDAANKATGDVVVRSGEASSQNSGQMLIQTGDGVHAGSILMNVGTAQETSGSIRLISGSSTSNGGEVHVISGGGVKSGAIHLKTAESYTSGGIDVSTGVSNQDSVVIRAAMSLARLNYPAAKVWLVEKLPSALEPVLLLQDQSH